VTEPIRPLPDAVPVLPVADLVRALVWYERAGFTIDAEHPGYVLLRFDGTEVHLVEVPEVEGLDTWTGAYLRVADVDALFARWQALGLPVLAEPDDRPTACARWPSRTPTATCGGWVTPAQLR
jgi:hypothetical protein